MGQIIENPGQSGDKTGQKETKGDKGGYMGIRRDKHLCYSLQ